MEKSKLEEELNAARTRLLKYARDIEDLKIEVMTLRSLKGRLSIRGKYGLWSALLTSLKKLKRSSKDRLRTVRDRLRLLIEK